MSIDRTRFCINRKTAPCLDIESFFRVVNKCGLNKVELRNDCPDGSITGGLSVTEINAVAKEYSIEIITINALYPFNYPPERAELSQKAEEMLSIAQQINCKAVILCPYNNSDDPRTEEQRQKDTLDSLQYFAPMFKKQGIQGLVEPLGFTISSLRSSLDTQRIIQASGIPFKIVLDTFHHHLWGVALEDFNRKIDISGIGLVHLSGVEDKRATDKLTDEERLMLTDQDVLKTKEQVINLERLGYKGIYSFEPFASSLQKWTESDIEREINHSIDLISH